MRLPTLWTRDRNDPFAALHREIEEVFEDFGRGWPSLPRVADRGFLTPSIEVRETDKGLEVTAELPGVDQKDVEVTLADNVLTIKGEKKSEREEQDKGRFISERFYGAFQRSLSLPYDVDQSKIEALFDKGVLKVTLPRSPEVEKKTTRIAVKGA